MYRYASALLIALVVLASPLAPQAAAPEEIPTALLIIDIQEFYFPGGSLALVAPEAASANAGRLLAKFRAEGRFVVHVGHNASKGKAFHSAVRPKDGEAVVFKDEVNAFLGTDLLERLRAQKTKRLLICGMQTHMCLEAATRAAHDLGFEVIVVADACATRDLSHGKEKIRAAHVHAATLATLDGSYARVVDTETALAEY